MKYATFCSGIGAPELAFMLPGWQAVAYSEVEDFARAVFRERHPGSVDLGDMSKITLEQIEWMTDEQVEFLFAGCPCQAFSIAGKRDGLEDARGNLTLLYARLIHAIKSVRWAGFENVPGILSDRTNAFGCFLAELCGADAPLVPARGQSWTDAGVVAGPLGTAAWRILDSQFFGVAQRRRRVYLLFSKGAGNYASARALFPHAESLSGDTPPSREARQSLTYDVAPCLSASGRGTSRAGETQGQDCLIPEKTGTLSCRGSGGGGLGTDFDLAGGLIPEIANALQERDWRGSDSDTKEGHLIPEICPTLRAGANRTGGDRPPGTDVDTVDSLIPVQVGELYKCYDCFKCVNLTSHRDTCPQCDSKDFENVMSSPKLGPRAGQHFNFETQAWDETPIAFDTTQITCPDNRSNPQPGDPCRPLAAAGHAPAIAFEPRVASGRRAGVMGETVGALTKESDRGDGHPCVAYQEPFCFEQRIARNGRGAPEELIPPLKAQSGESGKGDSAPCVAYQISGNTGAVEQGDRVGALSTGTDKSQHTILQRWRVRRLTPRECERLQFFPDDFTKIAFKGRPVERCPDGPRYKVLGNTNTVSVVRWIAGKIQEVQRAG